MRTTITIPREVLEGIMEVSGKEKYSEAIVVSLKEYLALKQRLQLLEDLFSKKLPHSYRKIKSGRRKGQWSS
jgi:hypothetical protein